VKAFSVTELLVTVACLALLAAVFLPALAKSKARSSRINCSNCLKQIGLAFRCWAIDNNDHYPMQVSVTNDGTMELAASGFVYPHFQVMSNELSTPKILLCPEDKDRRSATNFTRDLTDKNLSYFLNLDTVAGAGSSLLSGDRNITNRASAWSRLVDVTKGPAIAWNKEIHSEKGNLGFADGSVDVFTNQRVGAAIQMLEGVTNRLAVP
jgi:prepilin-type processing-associated H-X9-DG protein